MNVTAESMRRRFLIIARVGDASSHPSWLEPQEFRSFDLCLCYSGDQTGRYAGDCEYYLEAPRPEGTRARMKDIVQLLGENLERYEAVWAADERLETNAFTIARMFHIFADQELWLAQPALTEDSSPCGSVPRHHPDYILRYIRLLEWTVPVFTPAALKDCISALDGHSAGTGFQFLWPGSLTYPQRRTAVIDVTPVKLALPEEQETGDPERSREPHVLQEAPAEVPADHNAIPGEELEREGTAEADQPPRSSRRKTSRSRRQGPLGRSRKKPAVKLKGLKKHKFVKFKKKKLLNKRNKPAPLPREYTKHDRQIPAAKQRRLYRSSRKEGKKWLTMKTKGLTILKPA